MTISFNKYQFYGKVLVLTIILFVVGLFWFYGLPITSNNPSVGERIFLGVASIFSVFFLIQMILQLFFLPKGVQINHEDKALNLGFLFSAPITVQANDLIGYRTINVDTKSTRYQGVLIRIRNGKEFILGDFNLQDFKPVKAFLEENNVLFMGHYKFSFFSYFLNYLKH